MHHPSTTEGAEAVQPPPSRFVLADSHSAPAELSSQLVFLKPEELQWQKLVPPLGDRSPEIVILHVHPATRATTLMIRTPRNFHVPRHWHSHGEKHTVISGSFIFECNGRCVELKSGSFNYIPPRVIHQAWTPPNEDCVLFTDVEGPWDVNWVEPPPWVMA